MNRPVLLSILFCFLLVSLTAVPVLAATGCPSSCSCLQPGEAKKSGSPGYCGGKQITCDSDTLKNEEYCYEKPAATVPQLIITARPFVTTPVETTPTVTKPAVTAPWTPATPAAACPSGCTCLNAGEGKAKGLATCGGTTAARCGDDTDGTPRFCFAVPAAATAVPSTAIMVPVTPAGALLPVCPSGCTCLAADKADAAGFTRCSAASSACGKDPAGGPMYCYAAGRVPAAKPPGAGNTTMLIPAVISTTGGTAPVPSAGVFTIIRTFFSSLSGSPPQGSTSSRRLLCNGTFTDIMADPANCGSCGAFCAEGQECRMGTCRGGEMLAAGCGPFQIPCNGTCISYLYDDNNCGGCGNRCAIFDTCCNGRCTNTNSDPENCYDCGTSCGESAACTTGVCTCINETILCGTACTDPRTDNDHCGGCNLRCPAGETCCNGICRNTGRDLYNCGACNHFCEMPYTCMEGRCMDILTNEEHCGTTNTPCGDGMICCNGRCVAYKTDNNNCGSCGNECGRGEECCDGTCTTDAGFESDLHNCGSCGNACGYGKQCCGGSCCDDFDLCCGGTCHSRWSDDNCGSCGRECAWYEDCENDGYFSFGTHYQCCYLFEDNCGVWNDSSW